MGADWQKFDVKIPKKIKDKKDQLALGEQIIEYIRKRTESGKDNRGGAFPRYSKDYMNSLDFKIAGKSSKVNLTQTGDMLADISVLSMSNGKLTIGFEKGSDSNDKADGHITGWQGRSKTKRPFLGFVGSEKSKLKNIIDKFSDDIKEENEERLVTAFISALDVRKAKKNNEGFVNLLRDED
jgi:hypothetical protein